MTARFNRASDELSRAGYRVVRIPNLPFDDKTYVSYTNGVYETRGEKKTAWVPQYGFEALDREALRVYRELRLGGRIGSREVGLPLPRNDWLPRQRDRERRRWDSSTWALAIARDGMLARARTSRASVTPGLGVPGSSGSAAGPALRLRCLTH